MHSCPGLGRAQPPGSVQRRCFGTPVGGDRLPYVVSATCAAGGWLPSHLQKGTRDCLSTCTHMTLTRHCVSTVMGKLKSILNAGRTESTVRFKRKLGAVAPLSSCELSNNAPRHLTTSCEHRMPVPAWAGLPVRSERKGWRPAGQEEGHVHNWKGKLPRETAHSRVPAGLSVCVPWACAQPLPGWSW